MFYIKNLTSCKLLNKVYISEEMDHVKGEFESNMRMDSDKASRKIILQSQGNTSKSECKEMIFKLACTPSHNK